MESISSLNIKICVFCKSDKTWLQNGKPKWRIIEGKTACGLCYQRYWHNGIVDIVRDRVCHNDPTHKTILTKNGVPMWYKNKDQKGTWLCHKCRFTGINSNWYVNKNNVEWRRKRSVGMENNNHRIKNTEVMGTRLKWFFNLCKADLKPDINLNELTFISEVRRRFNTVRYRAYRKKLDFNLTVEFLCDCLSANNCSCCNKEFKEFSDKTIDRIDSTKGYTIDNVGIICYRCNNIKCNGNSEDFYNIVRYINK